MDKGRNNRGQTLVELALVLPCFCLGVFMAVQLMTYCHNMIELQRMAQVMIDRITYKNYRSSKIYTRPNSLDGKLTHPMAHFSTERVQPWRPFNGISTVDEEGRFFKVKVDTTLLTGNGFRGDLERVKQQAFAETYLEPPLPPED